MDPSGVRRRLVVLTKEFAHFGSEFFGWRIYGGGSDGAVGRALIRRLRPPVAWGFGEIVLARRVFWISGNHRGHRRNLDAGLLSFRFAGNSRNWDPALG